MGLFDTFKPKPTLSEEDISRGLRWMTWEGTASLGFWSITTSGFLAAYALALGCNNLQIGILAAIPMLSQLIQILAIPLIERFRKRKLIAIAAWLPAQLIWIMIALIPLFLDVPSNEAVMMLLGLIAFRGIFHAINSCAWNGWVRDLVPQQILGSFYAQRQMKASVAAMLFGLGAAIFVDFWKGETTGDTEVMGYTLALLFGAVFLGMASPIFMSMMPEPLMQSPAGPQSSLFTTISEPFKDKNFRHLLWFLLLWGFALNLATPFFAVYMLKELNLSLSVVLVLSMFSQISNIFFLRVWGPLADRFGLKAILSAAASLYLLVILGWTFTTMPDKYFLTIPLLIMLHFLAGIASAGVTITTATIGMKLAPPGKATAYLSAAAIATSLGSGLGPLMGGWFADFFSKRHFSINFHWTDPNRSVDLTGLDLTGFDFLFAISFVVGLLTLNLLMRLREEGEVSREVVLEALFAPGQQFSRPMSSVPGLNFLGQFPYGQLRRSNLPGLDVAVGVTSYQLADMTRRAVIATTSTGRATVRIAKVVEDLFSDIGKATRSILPAHRFEAGRHAARGVMHVGDESQVDSERLSHSAVTGVARALRWQRKGQRDVLRGAGYGAVQGASETGADLVEAASQAIEAAGETSQYTGLSKEAAESQVARGVMEAANAIGPEVAAKVMASLPEKMIRAQIASELRHRTSRRVGQYRG